MGVNLSNKLSYDKVIILFLALMTIGAVIFFLSEGRPDNSNNASLKKEPEEFTSKRVLVIISDTKWREGHIQFDQLRLMGFNLTVVKAGEYRAEMLNNADVVMFDYILDSVNIKDKDSIRDFVEKKGKSVIFVSPAGLNVWWKKERYTNTPFSDLSIKIMDTKAGLNVSGEIIPTTQYNPQWIYQINRFGLKNLNIWGNYYFILPNGIQIPVAYILDSLSGGRYIIYSGSHLALLPPELIQSLIYLDEPHFETVYTKDNIKNNFTYLIRIDDVGDQSKKLGREKDWISMLMFDNIADSYGFGVNHLVILNRTQGADDVLAYLKGYRNGKWIALHGWKHNKPDGVHPEFEINNKTFQEDILRLSKQRFYELFGYYPEYIATPWNAHLYNFSNNVTDDDFGTLTLFKKYGFFAYSLSAEQGNIYTPFMLDGVIIIQVTPFSLDSKEFGKLIKGASGNGWIIENYGHYYETNISQSANIKYNIVSKYNVWNPDPNEFAEFLHALSGLHTQWEIGENNATIELKSDYTVPAGFTLRLADSDNIINQVYIDNNVYKYFTNKLIVFPEISQGAHTVKIYFKKQWDSSVFTHES